MIIRQLQPLRYGVALSINTTDLANTGRQIVAPASNVNGLVLWRLDLLLTATAGAPRGGLYAKTSAPSSISDSDLLAVCGSDCLLGTVYVSRLRLAEPVFIAAGKGLYYLSDVATIGSTLSALYTLR